MSRKSVADVELHLLAFKTGNGVFRVKRCILSKRRSILQYQTHVLQFFYISVIVLQKKIFVHPTNSMHVAPWNMTDEMFEVRCTTIGQFLSFLLIELLCSLSLCFKEHDVLSRKHNPRGHITIQITYEVECAMTSPI